MKVGGGGAHHDGSTDSHVLDRGGLGVRSPLDGE